MQSSENHNDEIQRIHRLIDTHKIKEALNAIERVDVYARFSKQINIYRQTNIEINAQITNDIDISEELKKARTHLKSDLVRFLNDINTYYDFLKLETFLKEGRYEELFPLIKELGKEKSWGREIDDIEAAYREFERQFNNGVIDLKRFTKNIQPIKGRLASIIEAQKEVIRKSTNGSNSKVKLKGESTSKTGKQQQQRQPIEDGEVLKEELEQGAEETNLKTKTITTYLPRYQSDRSMGEDQLDILHEVDAFMHLVMSKALKPPLSIGLLGNWGSGKSFFMNKLIERIDLKSKAIVYSRAGEEDYCINTVQIKFNAWYYVDANLWASLVNKIFQELGKQLGLLTDEEKIEADLYGKLASTNKLKQQAEETINQIKLQKEALNQELEVLEAERQRKKETLEGIRVKDVLIQLKDDKPVKEFIEDARDKLDFDEGRGIKNTVVESLNDVNGLLDKYNASSTKIIEAYKYLSTKKSKPLLVLLLFILAPIVIIYLVNPYLNSTIKNPEWLAENINLSKILTLLTTIASIVAAASKSIKTLIKDTEPVFSKINAGINSLNLAKTNLEKLEEIAMEEVNSEIALLQGEIENFDQREIEIINRKSEIEADIDNIKSEIEAINAGKRFSSFLEKRIASEDYKKHLGIISLIREDFSKLTEYFQQNITEVTNDLKVDRVVLYIDDLDRCPPDKVVEVLQAIHLILAFELFVVVVGVDVRWIYNSLVAEYGEMLHNIDKIDCERELRITSSATPFDYLEKVFQIPFQIKAIDDDGKAIYISKLLEGDIMEDPQNLEQDVAPSVSNQEIEENEFENHIQDSKDIDPLIKIDKANKAIEEEVRTNFELMPLKIYTSQYEFISYLAPIIGDSPRSIKRFINVARLVKSNPRWIPTYNENDALAFPCFLTMMSIIIGTPSLANFFIDRLKNDHSSINLGELVTHNSPKQTHNHESKIVLEQWELLRDFVIKSKDNQHEAVKNIYNFDIGYLREIQPIVARFSFRTLL